MANPNDFELHVRRPGYVVLVHIVCTKSAGSARTMKEALSKCRSHVCPVSLLTEIPQQETRNT